MSDTRATRPRRFGALYEANYAVFAVGYSISYTLYWVTLLAVGWWTWEVTKSPAWVGAIFFCDLFPAVLVTPWAAALADRGDRFRLLRTVLWVQVVSGAAVALLAYADLLTPVMLALFVLFEGAMVGISQPAFFGLVNRLVSPANLSSAVSVNISIVHGSYVLGPLLAAAVFSLGFESVWLAFAANSAGTLLYLGSLFLIRLRAQAPRADTYASRGIWRDVGDGLVSLWRLPFAFRAVALILGAAILQRPLVSLLPGINDRFNLFASEHFTVLTASFMGGSVLASLTLARRNSPEGLERLTLHGFYALASIVVAFFAVLQWMLPGGATACLIIGCAGYLSSWVWTGNAIILQDRTPENLRSRILGNNFMLSRAVGALSVAAAGALAEATDFAYGFWIVTLVSALLVLTIQNIANRRGPAA